MPHQDAPTTTIVLEVDGAGTMVEFWMGVLEAR